MTTHTHTCMSPTRGSVLQIMPAGDHSVDFVSYSADGRKVNSWYDNDEPGKPDKWWPSRPVIGWAVIVTATHDPQTCREPGCSGSDGCVAQGAWYSTTLTPVFIEDGSV